MNLFYYSAEYKGNLIGEYIIRQLRLGSFLKAEVNNSHLLTLSAEISGSNA